MTDWDRARLRTPSRGANRLREPSILDVMRDHNVCPVHLGSLPGTTTVHRLMGVHLLRLACQTPQQIKVIAPTTNLEQKPKWQYYCGVEWLLDRAHV